MDHLLALPRLVPRAAPERLPPYARMLAAYHRSHAHELRAMIADLPLVPGDRVLDMACGDGSYTGWLAERVAPHGRAVGVDCSPAYLRLAQATARRAGFAHLIRFDRGDVRRLRYAAGAFDLVWCAQSLYTLPNPAAALRELRRVTRPGGTVAIFENDLLHHIVLPWPLELELALRTAQAAALQTDDPGRLAIGRDLAAMVAAAGLTAYHTRSYVTTRTAPLSADELFFLDWYIADCIRGATPYLGQAERAALEHYADPRSPAYILHQPTCAVTYIDMVVYGQRE